MAFAHVQAAFILRSKISALLHPDTERAVVVVRRRRARYPPASAGVRRQRALGPNRKSQDVKR